MSEKGSREQTPMNERRSRDDTVTHDAMVAPLSAVTGPQSSIVALFGAIEFDSTYSYKAQRRFR